MKRGRAVALPSNPVERKLVNKSVKQGNPINLVAKVFGVNRKTVWYWKDETLNSNFEDLPRIKQSKITVEIEIAILFMRLTFKWGTARIQQGLVNLPDFQLREMEVVVQNLRLSRTSINNVLKNIKSMDIIVKLNRGNFSELNIRMNFGRLI